MPDRDFARIVTLPGPFGPVHVAASPRGVLAVSLFGGLEWFRADVARLAVDAAEVAAGGTAGGALAGAENHLDRLASELQSYFSGRATSFDVPLDLRAGSAWDRDVLRGVRLIPYGAVASYGEVAARIGRFGAARAVGGAVGRNRIAILVPCHRVIAAGGALGGYGGDWYGSREERLGVKRDLLRIEGVRLADEAPSVRHRHGSGVRPGGPPDQAGAA